MRRRVLGWGAAALGIVVFVLLLWKGPWWADGAHLGPSLTPGTGAVVTGFRTAVVAVGAGIVAGFGLFYTDRNFRHTRELFEHTREKDREQAELTREGLMTDRYAVAIGLMAAPELTKRLGGVYALDRIMRDSPKDHATVVQVLAAFIREHAPIAEDAGHPEQGEPVQAELRPAEHVTAALAVLGSRPERPEPFQIDLRRTDLRGAGLRNARLEGVRLGGARLDGADLRGADLRGAWLRRTAFEAAYMSRVKLDHAYLGEAGLARADLREAHMEGSNLTGADLTRTNLSEANLEEADLSRARLGGAQLRGALLGQATLGTSSGLTASQLLTSRAFTLSKLPKRLADDPEVRAGIHTLRPPR